MIYESSYETGQLPFVPDMKRGHWAKDGDFVYAGLSLAFRLDMIAMIWTANINAGASSFFFSYLLALALYIIPLLMVKTFLGQFSSSGFISFLRLCPLFKGLGYISMMVNVFVIIRYTSFAAIPLVFLTGSLNPTLPWSCESMAERHGNETKLVFCVCSNSSCEKDPWYNNIGSVLHLQKLFEQFTLFGVKYAFSWQLILAALCVWLLLTNLILHLPTKKIGMLVRYAIWCVVALLIVFICRLSFLKGAHQYWIKAFQPSWETLCQQLFISPIYALMAFGPGWGLFISLASFNRFKANIYRNSWIIGLGQMFIIFGLDLVRSFILIYVKEHNNGVIGISNYFDSLMTHPASVLATLEWPNLWCFLFYAMQFMSSIIIMVLILHSMITTAIDEYIWLRQYRKQFRLAMMIALAVPSLYYSSRLDVKHVRTFFMDVVVDQLSINLLLIFVVTWLYGRERLQRDIGFMEGIPFATWKVYILRFFVPSCMLLMLIVFVFISIYSRIFGSEDDSLYDLWLKALPWLAVPALIGYNLYRSRGSLKERFGKCCRPTDWYPAEANDRQRYEEVMNMANMSHPLSEINCSDEDADVNGAVVFVPSS